MSNLVAFAKALADPTRCRIIHLVMNQALCVCELADILDMPQSSISSHVQIIRKAGFLEDERCEKWTYFRVTSTARPLIEAISIKFPFPDSLLLTSDQTRAQLRLAKRLSSCCPGPNYLNSLPHQL